jgi:hypothetical protein
MAPGAVRADCRCRAGQWAAGDARPGLSVARGTLAGWAGCAHLLAPAPDVGAHRLARPLRPATTAVGEGGFEQYERRGSGSVSSMAGRLGRLGGRDRSAAAVSVQLGQQDTQPGRRSDGRIRRAKWLDMSSAGGAGGSWVESRLGPAREDAAKHLGLSRACGVGGKGSQQQVESAAGRAGSRPGRKQAGGAKRLGIGSAGEGRRRAKPAAGAVGGGSGQRSGQQQVRACGEVAGSALRCWCARSRVGVRSQADVTSGAPADGAAGCPQEPRPHQATTVGGERDNEPQGARRARCRWGVGGWSVGLSRRAG